MRRPTEAGGATGISSRALRGRRFPDRYERPVGCEQREVLLDAIAPEQLDELDEAPAIVRVTAHHRVDEIERGRAEHRPKKSRGHSELRQVLSEAEVQI